MHSVTYAFEQACSDQMRRHVADLLMYLIAVLNDGDFLNDYLAHLPECGAGTAQAVGMILAALLGYPT